MSVAYVGFTDANCRCVFSYTFLFQSVITYNILKHRTYFLDALCLDSHTLWKVSYDVTIHCNDTSVYASGRLAYHQLRSPRTAEHKSEGVPPRCATELTQSVHFPSSRFSKIMSTFRKLALIPLSGKRMKREFIIWSCSGPETWWTQQSRFHNFYLKTEAERASET
jgi:hypothetical protein